MYQWSNDVSNVHLNPKLRTYCQYKNVFECENYLLYIKNFKLRQCLTKFRISDHVLEIEKGRHKNKIISPENILC